MVMCEFVPPRSNEEVSRAPTSIRFWCSDKFNASYFVIEPWNGTSCLNYPSDAMLRSLHFFPYQPVWCDCAWMKCFACAKIKTKNNKIFNSTMTNLTSLVLNRKLTTQKGFWEFFLLRCRQNSDRLNMNFHPRSISRNAFNHKKSFFLHLGFWITWVI